YLNAVANTQLVQVCEGGGRAIRTIDMTGDHGITGLARDGPHLPPVDLAPDGVLRTATLWRLHRPVSRGTKREDARAQADTRNEQSQWGNVALALRHGFLRSLQRGLRRWRSPMVRRGTDWGVACNDDQPGKADEHTRDDVPPVPSGCVRRIPPA